MRVLNAIVGVRYHANYFGYTVLLFKYLDTELFFLSTIIRRKLQGISKKISESPNIPNIYCLLHAHLIYEVWFVGQYGIKRVIVIDCNDQALSIFKIKMHFVAATLPKKGEQLVKCMEKEKGKKNHHK